VNFVLLVILLSVTPTEEPLEGPTVGMEGRVTARIPGALVEAKPVDEKASMIVRIASSTPGPDGTAYDIRYIGLEPGRYDLKGYLFRIDRSATTPIPSIPVRIKPMLPDDHQGQLVAATSSPLRFLGAYKWLLIGVGVLWLAALYPLIFVKRQRARLAADAAPLPPTLADRLLPLVQQAAAGTLSADGKGQLERLLLSHWRERLHLGEATMAEALVRLRQHREAGALLRALEDWLHRPPGVAAQVDVAAILAPYRSIPSPAQAEVLA
jgi:hypothetical protein